MYKLMWKSRERARSQLRGDWLRTERMGPGREERRVMLTCYISHVEIDQQRDSYDACNTDAVVKC